LSMLVKIRRLLQKGVKNWSNPRNWSKIVKRILAICRMYFYRLDAYAVLVYAIMGAEYKRIESSKGFVDNVNVPSHDPILIVIIVQLMTGVNCYYEECIICHKMCLFISAIRYNEVRI